MYSSRRGMTSPFLSSTARTLDPVHDRKCRDWKRGSGALAREALGVTLRAEGLDRVERKIAGTPQRSEQRTHVALVCVGQDPMSPEDVSGRLRVAQFRAVDEQRLRVRRLDVDDRLDHRVDLPFDV